MMCKKALLSAQASRLRACKALSYCIILFSVLFIWQQPPHSINNAVCLELKTLFGGRCWQMWVCVGIQKSAWIFLRILINTPPSPCEGKHQRDCIVTTIITYKATGFRRRKKTESILLLPILFACFLFNCLLNPRMSASSQLS